MQNGKKILIRKKQQYVLQAQIQSQSNYKINLFTVLNYKINQAYQIQLSNISEIKMQNNNYRLDRWFDDIGQLINYLNQNGQNEKAVDVNIQNGIISLYIQVIKNRNNYIKIGQLKLEKLTVNNLMQCKFILDKCLDQDQLQFKQIIQYSKILIQKYDDFIKNYQNLTENKASDFQKLQKNNLIQSLIKCIQEKILVQQGLVKNEISYLQKQTAQFYKKRQIKLNEIQKQIAQKQKQDKKLNMRQQRQIVNKKQLSKLNLKDYINLQAQYFFLYRINEMQVSLNQNPYHNLPVMFTGTQKVDKHHPIPIIRFSIKIKKMQQKISLGLVSYRLKNKIRCIDKNKVIKYCSNGSITCIQTKINAGGKFKEGDTVTVFANIKIGIIYWASNGNILYSQNNPIFKKQIIWTPYIQLIQKGDSIQWIVQ